MLWWYAIDAEGQFVYTDGVLQRIKGWGKDPFAAALAAVEFVGPCRFDPDAEPAEQLDGRLHPRGKPNPTAWIQIAAVSKDQTRNTMTLFPGLFTPECRAEHGIDIGKEIIYSYQGARRIEAVTSSPRALEGGRPSFVVKNETHHWLANNEGHAMADVIERNAVKSSDGAARVIAITNAYDPAENSVAQHDREAWESDPDGSGTMYDSLEAGPSCTLDPEGLPELITALRGDSDWLNVDRIVKSIADPRNSHSRSRRFWLNQIVAGEDAWVDLADWDLCATELELREGDEIALFFDGSKSDDATALVACRISDGLIATIGMWQRPPGRRGDDWLAPRLVIDQVVASTHDRYKVVVFYGDPSHTRDDETQERYWDGVIDEWHRRYGAQLKVWAQPGARGHAVNWDMTAPSRAEAFTAAAERTASEIAEGLLTHDGDARLRLHVGNAKRYPTKWGVSLWKGARHSHRKVDLAVAAVGARMARRDYLNSKSARERPRTGVVYAA